MTKKCPPALKTGIVFQEVRMYKKQLTFQKIMCFAALVACGVMFFYSLGLSTDLYDGLFYALPEEHKIAEAKIPGSEIYYQIQPFNRQLLNTSIVLILLACLLFITSTHSRRRYYIGNAVSTLAFVGAGMGASLWARQQIMAFKAKFLDMDFDAYLKYATRRKKAFINSTFWFDAYNVVFILMLLVCIALVINFMWKLHLMHAEKKLIEQGKGVAA